MKDTLKTILGTDDRAVAVATVGETTVVAEQYISDGDFYGWYWHYAGQMENQAFEIEYADLARGLDDIGFDVNACIWERACYDCETAGVLFEQDGFRLCTHCKRSA